MIANMTSELDADIVATEGTLVAVQRKVLDFLRALSVLAPIRHMFHEDAQTIDDDLNKAMTGVEPLSIMVELGAWADESPGVPGRLDLSGLQVMLTVFENPLLSRGANGTGLTLNRVIETIATTLKCQPIGFSYLDKPRVTAPTAPSGESLVKTLVFTLSVSMFQTETDSEETLP